MFQDLAVNSFEQLCINFANEQLQHFVNKAVVSQEQVLLITYIWLLAFSMLRANVFHSCAPCASCLVLCLPSGGLHHRAD